MIFPKQNKADPRIWEFIKENPYCTTAAICHSLSIPRRTAEISLNRLMQRGLIHVADYNYRMHGSGSPPRVFVGGPGVNVRPRTLSAEQTRIRRNAWQKKRRAMKTVARKAKQGGVFGVLMAQIL